MKNNSVFFMNDELEPGSLRSQLIGMMECWGERWRTVIGHLSLVIGNRMGAWGDGILECWVRKIASAFFSPKAFKT